MTDVGRGTSARAQCLRVTVLGYRPLVVRSRTQAELDDMVLHVRYELLAVLRFKEIGNVWPQQLPNLHPVLATYVSESLLETVLLHTRNMIEFLQRPRPNDVQARQYIKGWTMPPDLCIPQSEYDDLSSRLIHIGFARCSVQREGDFYWSDWFDRTVPQLLAAFRQFLTRLPEHYQQLFQQPTRVSPEIDLVSMIDRLLGVENAG